MIERDMESTTPHEGALGFEIVQYDFSSCTKYVGVLRKQRSLEAII